MEAFLDQVESVWRYKYGLVFAGSAAAWVFSLLAVSRCTFMYDTEEVGFFSRMFLDQKGQRLGCVRYGSRFAPDPQHRAGQAFAILACLCTTVTLLSFGAALCWRFRPDQKRILWRGGRVCLGSALLSQLLSYTIAGSTKLCPNRCSLTGVGALSLFNIIVFAVLIVTSQCLSPPTHSWFALVTPEPTASNAGKDNVSSSPSSDSEPRRRSEDLLIQSRPRFRMAFVALLLLACVLSFQGLRRCSFVHVNTSKIGLGYGSMSSGLGLYTQAVDDQIDFLGCVIYPEGVQFDSSFRLARAFGGFAIGSALIAAFFGVAQLVLGRQQRSIWTMLRVTLPVAASSHLMTFTIFASASCNADNTAHCRLGESGTVVLLNVLLLVSLSAVVISTPYPSDALIAVIGRETIGQITSDVRAPTPGGDEDDDEDDTGVASHTGSSHSVTTSTVDHVSITIDYLGSNKRVTKVVSDVDGSRIVTMEMAEADSSDEDCSTVFTTTSG